MANPETRLTDNWFVIGTTSRTTGHKLVLKNLKHTKMWLAVGALDQFFMKFWGPCQSLQWLKTFAPTKSADS